MHTGEPRFTLAGHLEELRRRLGIALAALLVGVGVSFTRVEWIVQWLRRPAGEWLPPFAYFSPVEPLLAYVRVAVLGGLALTMPVILLQLWGFIRQGLTPRERSLGLVFIGWGSIQFLAGAAFAYYGLLPLSLRVLLSIGRDFLQPVLSIDRYLAFVTSLLFWCGLIFELPVVLWVLSRLGIVTPAWLVHQRPYAVLILVIIAAVVTPTTDPVSLCLMAVPLVLLYELSILMARVAFPRGPR